MIFPQGSANALPFVVLVCFLYSVPLATLASYSDLSGWKLFATIFVVFFGITTFLSQIETVIFLDYLTGIIDEEVIPLIFLHGLFTAALSAGGMTCLYRGGRGTTREVNLGRRILAGVAAISLIYPLIYILFGAFVFIPLAGEDFRIYYGDLQMPAWILPFQVVRGFLWALLSLLIVKVTLTDVKRTSLLTGTAFSLLMASSLLIPSEFMPERIRYAHFVEIALSNFLLGWASVRIYSRLDRSLYPDG